MKVELFDLKKLVPYARKTQGYWMWPQHPGEMIVGKSSFKSVRVPADMVVHVFRKLRPGQTRGVTAYAPSMVRMRDLDGYDDAELWRKKIEACFAAFVVQNNGADGLLPQRWPRNRSHHHRNPDVVRTNLTPNYPALINQKTYKQRKHIWKRNL